MSAEQGVKNISVGDGQCGNFIQDIAAIRALEELTNEYLIKEGYEDVVVTTVLHQWMGSFPQDEAKAFSVIALGSTLASLSKATKVIVKTPHEALGVPTMEANAQGLLCTKQILSTLKSSNSTYCNIFISYFKTFVYYAACFSFYNLFFTINFISFKLLIFLHG